MAPNRPAIVTQLQEIWTRLSWSQRSTILLFSALGIALIGSLVYFMNRVDFQVVFRNLAPEDSLAIAEKLEAENIEYEYREGRTAIAVKASEKDIRNLIYDIGSSGLAGNGRVGFEIFDETQWGMTDFTEKIKQQRALEGDLGRTIESLKGISQAKVHLNLGDNSPYGDDKNETSASVVVVLGPGVELSKQQIAGIKAIVKGPVDGLSLKNISITDGNGILLTPMIESGESEQKEMEASYRKQMEKDMAANVISMLEPLVGKDKVRVTATIDMDFNTTEQMEETYNPNAQAILSQQTSEERSGSSNPVIPSGIPGIESNLESSTIQGTGSSQEQVRQSELTNYEVSKTVKHTVQPKGSVQRISVAVLLDHKKIAEQSEDGEISYSREPISDSDMEKYRNIVLTTVGYNEQRGDVVTLENVLFYSDIKPVEPEEEVPFYVQWKGYLIPAMKYLAFIVLFLLIYMLFLRPIRRRVSQALTTAALETGEATEARLPAGEHATAALTEGKSAGAIEAPSNDSYESGALPESSMNYLSTDLTDEQIERELMKEANMADIDNRKYAVMKNKLVANAKKDPEMVSQIIRSVLRERI